MDDIMKFAIIGLGNHAINRVMPAIASSGNTIGAIYSRNHEKASKESEKYGAEPFTNLESLFRKGDFESVYISSPNFLHFEHAKMSLEKGKNVLLEKQMTLSSEDAEKLVYMAKEKKLTLSVGFHMRFHPAVQELREMVQNSSLGQITYVSGIWGGLSVNRAKDPDREWWDDPSKVGGGSVMGTGVHVIDTVNFILGRHPQTVSCMKKPDDSVVEDTFALLADYNGPIASIVSSRSMKNPRNDLVISGTGNTVVASGLFGTTVDCKLTGPEGMLIKQYSSLNMYQEEILSFVRMCGGKDEIIASGEDGAAVVKIVNSAMESQKKGSIVNVN